MLLSELKSPTQVIELERQLDKLFSTVGLDVEFSKHFVSRILQREKSVTINEVVAAFSKLKKKFKNKLLKAKKQSEYSAILKDVSSELNIVFSVKGDKLKNITIKRKPPAMFHSNKDGGEILKVD